MATGRVPTTANSPLTTKGDLFGYSTTQARVAVGSDGDTLVADSAATTGLRWSGTPSASNPVINSAMDVWQRGTSFTVSAGASGVLTADRWQGYRSASPMTVSRQTTGDTTNLPFIQYCARVQRDNGNTATNGLFFFQNFETVNSIPFAGKTVTLSFYARRGANYSATSNVLNVQLNTGTGTDQNYLSGMTNQSAVISQTATLTTTWQRFSYSVTLLGTITQLAPNFYYDPTGTAGAADYFEITGVQLDIGSVALPFRRSGGTIQGELAACQRYYWRTTATSAFGILTPFGIASSTTNAGLVVQPPVTMRAFTSVDYGTARLTDQYSASPAITALAIGDTSGNLLIVNATSTGLTQGRAYRLEANNSTSGYFAVNGEL
jgi:hypothetical protein